MSLIERLGDDLGLPGREAGLAVLELIEPPRLSFILPVREITFAVSCGIT